MRLKNKTTFWKPKLKTFREKIWLCNMKKFCFKGKKWVASFCKTITFLLQMTHMIKEINITHLLRLSLKIKKALLLLYLIDLKILVIRANLLQLLFMDVEIQVKTVQLLHLEDKNFKKINLLQWGTKTIQVSQVVSQVKSQYLKIKSK